jgi:maltose-binding protein MalE
MGILDKIKSMFGSKVSDDQVDQAATKAKTVDSQDIQPVTDRMGSVGDKVEGAVDKAMTDENIDKAADEAKKYAGDVPEKQP